MKPAHLFHCACIALCGIAPAIASAQGADREREYTRQREAAARAADERAHIEAARTNNAPSQSSWGSATGVLGRVGHYNEISAERAAEIRAIEERVKAESKRSMELAKRYGAATQPYVDFYQGSGLYDADDARSLAYRTLDANDGDFTLTKAAPFNLNSVASYKQFNATATTAPFDQLASLALNFCVMPAKSVAALQSLSRRFPERQHDIDMALISALQGHYGSNKFSTLSRPSMSYKGPNPKKAIYESLDSLFFSLARKYPDSVGAAIDAEYNDDGYRMAMFYNREMGKKGEAKLLALQQEYLALPSEDIRKRSRYCSEYIGTKGLPFVKELAAKAGRKPLDLIVLGYNNEDNTWFNSPVMTFRQSPASMYKIDTKDPFSAAYGDMIHQLANEGVPEAMNVYALRTVNSWTDDDVAEAGPWLQKAAAKGSTDAQKNLDAICSSDIKGMKKWCKSR